MESYETLFEAARTGELHGIKLEPEQLAEIKQKLVTAACDTVQADDGGASAYLHRHDKIGTGNNEPEWRVNKGEVKHLKIGERYHDADSMDMIRFYGSASDSQLAYEVKQTALNKALENAGADLDDIPPDIMRMYGPELISRIRDDRDFWDRHEEMKKGWRANAGISPDGKEMTGKAKRKKEKAERRAARESGVDFGIK